MSIITASELNTYTGQTLDTARAAQVVAAVNSFIKDFTGRSFGATTTVTDELHDYAPVIFLRNQDVKTVTAVKQGNPAADATTLDTSDYFANELGRLVLSESRTGFRRTRDYIRVSYTHGVTTVPDDLKLAALSLGADYYNHADSNNQELTAEGIGSYRLSYASGQNSAAGASHFDTIKRYRKARL